MLMKELREILIEESTSKITTAIDTTTYTNGEIPNVTRQVPKGWRIYGWKDVNGINKDTKYNEKLIINKDGYISTKWINGKGSDKDWNDFLIKEYFWGDNWLTKLLKSWKIVSTKKPDELIYFNEEINSAYKNKDISFNGFAYGLKSVEEKTEKYLQKDKKEDKKIKKKYPNMFD